MRLLNALIKKVMVREDKRDVMMVFLATQTLLRIIERFRGLGREQ